MIQKNGKRSGFTLIELLVVIAMIVILMGALTTSISSAQKRARIQKATAEVKVISQAILGYENHAKDYELPIMTRQAADSSSLAFLLGNGATGESGNKIPALLMASLRSSGAMVDPWGTAYRITIRETKGTIKTSSMNGLQTGYYLPNVYRLSKDERELGE